ncbi:autotransporter assembly complex protein TamA [Nitratifractor salsuginis]|uniref:Surface antigen (D15) n=1 Tax=Nitratifractor salsuginis (strain DSM 16511 / JCM 12458 / E9I37-1) TaxID=749222 RepID=E6WXZ2_NITSE|nr:BamA/TamA family outer membrane protein [Nitratifractor salsuginis]ADV46366.1 surface antigen (D15) [Nitratifractor salsuginis DSM 16511]
MTLARLFLFILALTLLSGTLEAAPDPSESNSSVKEEKTVRKVPVEVKGLKELDPDELLKVIGAEVNPWYIFWGDHTPKIPEKLIPAIPDTLRGWLDSQGYYDATFEIKKSPDKLIIIVHEGKPVVVKDINVSSDFPIEDYITFHKGDPFKTKQFVDIKSKIKTALLKEGYCSYDLDTKAYVDLDRRSVDLVYRLNKGDLCHFGNTTIKEKPEGLRDAVILSRMRYRPGDLFTTERVNESYAALNQLGIFGQTVINTDIKYFNEVRPEVYARLKQKMQRYTVSVGYDTVDGFRARATYDHFNFMGDGRKVGVVAQYSAEKSELTVNFFQPALFQVWDRYIDLYADGGYRKEAYDFYDEQMLYLDTKLGYDDGEWSYDLGLRYEFLRISETETPDRSEEKDFYPGDFNLFYGYMHLNYDRRDSKTDPRNGYYLSGYLEYGYSMGDEENTPYYKAILEGHYIKSFGLLTLAGVGKAGVIEDTGTLLPASKYFYAGGEYSNRAYGERDIGLTVSPTRDRGLGGRTWLNFTAEAQYPIWGDLYGGIFYDATLIAEDPYSITGASWIQTAGAGIRYMTPVGPLKLDFGANIHDPGINRISIMIGQSF